MSNTSPVVLIGRDSIPDGKDNVAVFNRVANWLLSQHKRSMRRDRNAVEGISANQYCGYRGMDDGGNVCLACAAGCLIADEDYSREMEGHSLNEMLIIIQRDDTIAAEGMQLLMDYFIGRGFDLLLLRDLQEIHDQLRPETWAKHLLLLSLRLGLPANFPYSLSDATGVLDVLRRNYMLVSKEEGSKNVKTDYAGDEACDQD